MNGVVVHAQSSLEDTNLADAIIIGSGMQTREVVSSHELMGRLALDPDRQSISARCSGTLILAKVGLLDRVPACTELTTKAWVQELGEEVLNRPFFANGNSATAGGCLSSVYLAAWIIARTEGVEAVALALHYFAPVGEKDVCVSNTLKNTTPYVSRTGIERHIEYREGC